jgi:hypothetical protein
MAEESGDTFGGEIIQFEGFDSSLGVLGHVSQQHEEGISVAAESMVTFDGLVGRVFKSLQIPVALRRMMLARRELMVGAYSSSTADRCPQSYILN